MKDFAPMDSRVKAGKKFDVQNSENVPFQNNTKVNINRRKKSQLTALFGPKFGLKIWQNWVKEFFFYKTKTEKKYLLWSLCHVHKCNHPFLAP